MKTVIEVRILKTHNCPSRSGKSTLTYQIGVKGKGDILQFRVSGNTGNGFFNDVWIDFKDIEDLLDKPGHKFTSFTLTSLYLGQSNNTPGFLLAALAEEGLVRTQGRSCEWVGSTGFKAEIQALIASKTDLNADDKPSKSLKKKVASEPEDAQGTTV